jgi:tRNA 2-thiouridine synthesizing protein B
MSTLHIISCAPSDKATLDSLIRSCQPEDGALLTGNGVYLGLPSPTLPGLPGLHALRHDVEARGLLSQWPTSIPLVDHAGYVDLCIRFTKSLNWS